MSSVDQHDPQPPTSGLGLVLFPADNPPQRRRRLAFLAVYVLVAVGLTLPTLPGVWGSTPLILGLPTSLSWVILNLAVIFVALVVLFRTEMDAADESAAQRDGGEEG